MRFCLGVWRTAMQLPSLLRDGALLLSLKICNWAKMMMVRYFELCVPFLFRFLKTEEER